MAHLCDASMGVVDSSMTVMCGDEVMIIVIIRGFAAWRERKTGET